MPMLVQCREFRAPSPRDVDRKNQVGHGRTRVLRQLTSLFASRSYMNPKRLQLNWKGNEASSWVATGDKPPLGVTVRSGLHLSIVMRVFTEVPSTVLLCEHGVRA